MTDESNDDGASMADHLPSQPMRPAKAARVRAACSRCQRRKMKCDGLLPSCKPCSRAGVACTRHHDPDSSRETRIYVDQLRSRIAWLENTVQTQCPEVSLSEAPSVPRPSPQPESTDQLSAVEGRSQSQQDQSQSQSQSEQSEYPQKQPQLQEQPANLSLLSSVAAGLSPAASGRGDDCTVRPTQQRFSATPDTSPASLDHEIGLVSSSAGADHRYIGASSGYSFAKLILSTIGGRPSTAGANSDSPARRHEATPFSKTASTIHHRILELPRSPLPKTWEHASHLSSAYFDTVHLQFPFLHRPSYEADLRGLYAQREHAGGFDQHEDPITPFQTYMVMAIASTIVSRRAQVALSSEGYSVSALEYLQHINLTGSIRGLQCTLLLLIYALNNPYLGLNMWYLHHQCVASLVDLGLHCQLPHGNSSLLEDQLKRRAFMCIYTMDKTLATIMGRPCALRDEDCSCQPPEDVNDDDLSESRLVPRVPGSPPTCVSNAIHLFELARMNSEIRYFLHWRPSDSFSLYIQPPSVDLEKWQQNMLTRLHQWVASIPKQSQDGAYITELSEIKYHNTIMLLLRPSPSIRVPSETALTMCYESAVQNLKIYNRLYKRNVLAYSWVTVHAVFLSSLTMLYCIWTMADSPMRIRIDVLVSNLKAGSDVLSATGEHWPQARRCRDALENLSNSTINWVSEVKEKQLARGPYAYTKSWNGGEQPDPLRALPDLQPPIAATDWSAQDRAINDDTAMDTDTFTMDPTVYLDLDIISSVFGGPIGDVSEGYNANSVLRGIFSDFEPTLNFLDH